MVKVKILGINGSPRAHGNTEVLVKEALAGASSLPDVETEYIAVAELNIAGGCTADYSCWMNAEAHKCFTWKDDGNMVFRKMVESDGIIIGCPAYWGSVPAQLKNVMDRSMVVEIDFMLRNKVGGSVIIAAERHGGHETTAHALNYFFITHDMIVVGVGPERPKTSIGGHLGAMALQGFPYPVHSNIPGENRAVIQDDIGMGAAQLLGKRVTEMAKLVKAGMQAVPEKELPWGKQKVGWKTLEKEEDVPFRTPYF